MQSRNLRLASSQALLHRFLKGCRIVPLGETQAHRIGRLLAKAGTSDIADACVVELATEHAALIVTSDEADLGHLIAAAGVRIPLMPV
jgi:predicted nucleic acid-binding protein